MSDYLPSPLGPKRADHPSLSMKCPACQATFAEGDYTTLVALGPGSDPAEQAKCREGQHYKAVALEVHYLCATGVDPENLPDGTEA